MKLLTEIKVKVKYDENDIFSGIKRKYNLEKSEILSWEIVKESIDSRKKPEIFVSLNLAVEVAKKAQKKVSKCSETVVSHEGITYEKMEFHGEKPVVVGFGPSGMFAGLALALAGLEPIILEQGKCVSERQKDVDEFWQNRKLNKFSNIQFGEGGAGTFSDGKLASNVSNAYTKKVINELILCGAPSEIFYSSTPHIGSDKLKEVVTNIRTKIEENGGKVLFNSHFDGFELTGDKISKVKFTDIVSGETREIKTSAIILAVGHSAVDVYKMLKGSSCEMKQKPFAMGVRIEQKQSDLNFAQYGKHDSDLPPANYKLVEHLENGRSVFTFCMCPGGYVVASSSDEGTVVTNGMSNYARDGENANSAVLVNVVPEDYSSSDVLAGVEFQHRYEKLAFELGGRNYNAPAELVGDFVSGAEVVRKTCGKVRPTYLPSITFADLRKCLPDFVYESLKEALPKMDKKIHGFASDDNLLIGVESRSSAPVQIVRDENFMTNITGLFASGEGSGYAGGITTSAADGVKCAEAVMNFLK